MKIKVHLEPRHHKECHCAQCLPVSTFGDFGRVDVIRDGEVESFKVNSSAEAYRIRNEAVSCKPKEVSLF